MTAPPAGRRVLARELRAALGPAPVRDCWPGVSIVVPSRNGRAHLERLVPGLQAVTDYPEIELVVIDNGSQDDSVEFLDSVGVDFPIVVEHNRENVSFSRACNRGAEVARFDLLLFLNNDVEPFEPGWLREMVDCLARRQAGVVGATLLEGVARASVGPGGYALQHRCIRFRRVDGGVTAFNQVGALEARSWDGADQPAPAVTGACLLIERATFEAVGGFTPGFRYGYEDVDLGLKVMATGRSCVGSGRALAVHHEAATRRSDLAHHMRPNREFNQRLLMKRWAPQLEREYTTDRQLGRGFWSERAQPAVAITLGAGTERDDQALALGDALEQQGWQPAYVHREGSAWSPFPADVDLVLVTDSGCGALSPPAVPVAGWVGDDAQVWLRRPWLRRVDVLLAASPTATRLVGEGGRHAVAFPPDGDWRARARELIELVGLRCVNLRIRLELARAADGRQERLDSQAAELRRGLESRGHLCAVALADERERIDGLVADAVIAIGHRPPHGDRGAQLEVLWMPERLTGEILAEGWDLIAVDGDRFAGDVAPPLLALAPMTAGQAGGVVERLLDAIAARIDRVGIAGRVAA